MFLTFPSVNALYCRQLTIFEVAFAYKTMHHRDNTVIMMMFVCLFFMWIQFLHITTYGCV